MTVTMTLDQLRGTIDGAVIGAHGSVLPAATRRLACDAAVIPIVLGSASEPLDGGRAQRAFPAAIRRAITARDVGCAWPGCDRPSTWRPLHHLTHWGNSGPTSAENGALLGGQHHREAHRDHHTMHTIEAHPHVIPPAWIDWQQKPRRNTFHHAHPPRT